MTYIATCIGYDTTNMFELKEIYVGNEETTYVFKKGSGYRIEEYRIPFYSFVYPNLLSPQYIIGPLRQKDERDTRSLANYIGSKLSTVDMGNPIAEKALYEVLSNFGREYVG